MNKLAIGLILGIGACGGYLAWDSMHKKSELEKKDSRTALMTVNYDQVEEVRIQKEGREEIFLKRSADGWRLEKPIVDNADSEAVDQFVKDIFPERAAEIVDSGEDKNFGFQPPAGILQLKSSSGESDVFHVSSLKNFENQTYLKRNQDKNIFVVSNQWLDRLSKSVDDFQDRRVLRLAKAKVHGIKIQQASGVQLDLVKSDDGWKMKSSKGLKLEGPVDPPKLSSFWEALIVANASHVLTSAEKLPSLKKLATVEVTTSEKPIVFELGQAEDKKVYAVDKTSGRSMKLAAGAMDAFIKIESEKLVVSDKKEAPAKKELQIENLELKGVIPDQENYESKKDIQ